MKMKVFTLLFVVLFSFLSCEKKEAVSKIETSVESVGNSRIIKSGDLQVAVDLLGPKEYMNMMSDMNDSMGMGMDSVKNYLSITVIDVKNGKIIEASNLELDVKKPSGESINIVPDSMGGAGMLHYGSPVDFSASGKYLVDLKLEALGKAIESDLEYMIE